MRYIHIKDGVITNVLDYLASPSWYTPEGEDILIAKGDERIGDPHTPTNNKDILEQISALENDQHRAVREAILGDAVALQKLSDTENRIVTLRSQIVK